MAGVSPVAVGASISADFSRPGTSDGSARRTPGDHIPGLDPVREQLAEEVVSDVPAYVRDEVIVRYADNSTSSSRREARRDARGEGRRDLEGLPNSEVIELVRGATVKAAVKSLSQRADVLYAQPNYLYTTDLMPTDPRFSELWGMHNTGQTGGTSDADIDAVEAWDLSTGSSDVIVGVIDSGVHVQHPDLASNIWVNPGEIPGNGLDDDSNGKVDDVNGYDFQGDDGDPDDQDGHGTHVSGTIAAAMNNGVGVVGVAPSTKIMALKFIGQTSGSTSDAIDAIAYAQAMGADVLNCSWGGGGYEQALYDAIDGFDGLVVCAAGNDGFEISQSGNKHYPASYTLDNVLSVASVDDDDVLYSGSNWGVSDVDVAAPGVAILSTLPADDREFATDVESVIFSDDFSTLTNWETYSHAGLDTWAIDGSRYVSSPSCVSLPDYENEQNAWLELKGPLDLSGVSGAALRFDADVDVEEDWDWLDVWAHDGSEWIYLSTLDSMTSGFESQWIDLTFMAGESSTTVAFQLVSDEIIGGDSGYEGVYIDDVQIVETAPRFFDDMTDLSAWETISYPGLNEWELYTADHISPPSMAAQSPYENDEDSWMILDAPIDLSGVSGGVAARHALYYYTEAGYDYVRSWASTDRATWTQLKSYTGFSHGYVDEVLDLSDWAGESVYLAFSLEADADTDSSSASGYLGGFIDDLVVETGTWDTLDYTNAYARYTGTSMATPHVAGLVALLHAYDPGLTTAQLKQRIMSTADPLPSLSGKVASGGRINAYRALTGDITPDTTPPVVTHDAKTLYQDSASITLSATDATTVASITYSLNGGADVVVPGDRAVVTLAELGSYTLRYSAKDALGNTSATKQHSFTIERGPITFESIAGANRYDTAALAALRGFDSAPAVVVATGRSWPDALGGAALAGVVGGPVLLTDPNQLSTPVIDEIDRLGATKVYVLGGTGAVSSTVRNQLAAIVGNANVERIGGANRYATARMIADKVIELSGGSFDGTALIATGSSFPDALAGSPVAFAKKRPLLLAGPTSVSLPPQVDEAVILGGTGAVTSAAESYLKTSLGAASVTRVAGSDRYATAVEVAEYAVGEGLVWNGAGLATGANFPDALSGGPVLGKRSAVMLLTRSSALPASTQVALEQHRNEIRKFTFIGGTGAVSDGVRYLVQIILE